MLPGPYRISESHGPSRNEAVNAHSLIQSKTALRKLCIRHIAKGGFLLGLRFAFGNSFSNCSADKKVFIFSIL